jgi:hypothetical protein
LDTLHVGFFSLMPRRLGCDIRIRASFHDLRYLVPVPAPDVLHRCRSVLDGIVQESSNHLFLRTAVLTYEARDSQEMGNVRYIGAFAVLPSVQLSSVSQSPLEVKTVRYACFLRHSAASAQQRRDVNYQAMSHISVTRCYRSRFSSLEAAEGRWRKLTGSHPVALVRVGAEFTSGELVEGTEEKVAALLMDPDSQDLTVPPARECSKLTSQ